jgi:hypothetical protein
MAKRLWVGGLAAALLGPIGCQTSVLPVGPVVAAPVSHEAYETVFRRAVEVLRDRGFAVDRQDFRFGLIQTRPKGSPTVFEPWRPDNVRAHEAWQSTLGDLRRVVRVRFRPVDGEVASGPGADFVMEVQVQLERLQLPARRMSGRTHGAVFADLREVPEELQRRGIKGAYWQAVGRDAALEQRLRRLFLSNPDASRGR